jgi:probable F420-dependent oxidoreductase
MIVSAGLPTCMEGMMYPVPFASPDDLVTIAKTAERLGYHSIWGNDHMTTQRYVRQSFPQPPNFWEILITYAYLASETSEIKMGTGMLVVPMRRDIVVTAKQVATLDAFSKGRVLLGLGVGAYREEFEALNPDLKAHRGQMVEEGIQALRLLFTERTATFRGRYYHFEDVEMYPKPVQKPLPLYIGGNSSEAIERTARSADGWLGAALPAEQLRQRVVRLSEIAEAAGRDPCRIDIAMQAMVLVGSTRESAVRRFRETQMYHHMMSLRKSTLKDQDLSKPEDLNFIGTASQIVEKAQMLAEAGLTHLCGLYFVGNSVEEVLDQMESFAAEVMPTVAG